MTADSGHLVHALVGFTTVALMLLGIVLGEHVLARRRKQHRDGA